MTGIGISTLRVCILSAAGAACVVAVSTPALIAHAAIAAALGAAGAELLQRRARTVALAIAAGIAGLAIAQLLVETPLAVARLGPARALHAREALIWISLLGPGVWALHALALRYPSLAALEIVVVGLALGAPLAAHRDGMIHRPLALGDLASARGLDPALVLFALGALAALALALLLLRSQGMRTLWHLGAIVLGVAVGWFAAQLGGPAAPQPAADLGLTGPAVERGAGGERSDAASHEQRDASSMSDFRDSYGARGGDTPVAILLFHDDHRPPGGVYYLRQTALSQFNGRRLVAITRAGIDTDVVPGFPTGRLQVLDAPDDRGRTRVTTTVGLLTSHVQPFALDAPVWLEPAPNPLPSRFARTYRALSHAPARDHAALLGMRTGAEAWSDTKRAHYLAMPEDPRYASLARDIEASLRPSRRSDPLAQALAIKRHLEREAVYSRESRHADAIDPAAAFLFGNRTGYCVHFAHAATYLMRSLGLPARVAIGYAVPEHVRGDGSALLVRGVNAHAWAELHLEGFGWVVIDPSPERALDNALPPPDPALQRLLAELLRRRVEPEPLPGSITGFDARRSLHAAGMGLGLGTLWICGLLVKLWRRVCVHLTSGRALPRLAYRAALDALAEQGSRRAHGETREHFAARVAEQAPSFLALTDLHLRARLNTASEIDPALLRRLVASLRRELRAQPRRFGARLRTLDPVSWWKTN
jgi:transglutaminase-like putative cysteine protease